MCPPSSFSDTTKEPASQQEPETIPEEVPQHPASISAYKLALTHLPTAIFNHSFRVYLYARALARRTHPIYAPLAAKDTILFVACMFHDIGCAERFNGPQRFDVDGADAAKDHLLTAQSRSETHIPFSEADAHDVWIAIACHNTPQIAERISPLSYLIRCAVLFDFDAIHGLGPLTPQKDVIQAMLTEELRRKTEGIWPRLQPERVLGDAVVAQAKKNRVKAPTGCWAGDLLRGAEEDPGWTGVNRNF